MTTMTDAPPPVSLEKEKKIELVRNPMNNVVPKYLTHRLPFSPYNEFIAPLISSKGNALDLFIEFTKVIKLSDFIYLKWNDNHTAIIDVFALKGYSNAGGKLKVEEISLEEAKTK